MRNLGFSALFLLAACHVPNKSVYDQTIPDRHDAQGLSLISDQLNSGDRPAWQDIEKRITNAGVDQIRSKTVGEAIRRWEAQRECMQAHAKGQEAAGDNVQARDREIDAYNDCLEMVI